MTEVCKKAIVRGHVQGVGYRYTTVMQADHIGGISGWARNCDDGSVEVMMRGEEGSIDQLVNWLHHGPDSAIVNSVMLIDIPDAAGADLHGFSIRYQ